MKLVDYGIILLYFAMTIIWVVEGSLLSTGGPAQMYDFQRFLAARATKSLDT